MATLSHRLVLVGLGVLILAGVLKEEPRNGLTVAPPRQWISSDVLGFEENRGQFEGRARYVAQGQGFALSLEPGGAVMSLRRPRPNDPAVAVRMTLVGGRAEPRLAGLDELAGKTHYLRGSEPAGWVSDVSSYARVEYAQVYPGIDLVFRGNEERIEYDFVVAPGADPAQIRLAFGGIEQARLDAAGDLLLETRAGAVRHHRPRLYQENVGARREIAGSFALQGPREVGFIVGPYDRTRPLVIDPTLVFSTLHGGCRGYQGIQDVTLDAAGNAYVVGYYPWDCDRGASNAFVTKFGPTGTLLFRTNFGGWFQDEARAVAVDPLGNIYVTGSTFFYACCPPFPTVNAFQPASGGGTDAFLIKFAPTGRTILYATYLGGAGDDRGADVEVDALGRIYVTGRTNSTNFPTSRPWQAALAGGTDAFLAAFDPTGASLLFSTYLGGSGDESVARLAVSERGIHIAGTTSSLDFPARNNGIQPVFGGGASDAFLAVISAEGDLKHATYLGGSGKDAASGIAINGGRSIYVTGSTDSPNFPTASPLQLNLSFPPEADAFLVKIAPNLTALAYSTYLGVGRDATCASSWVSDAPCGAVAVDASGNAYVTANGVFVTKVDAAGASRLYTTYGFGGHAIAVRHVLAPVAPEIMVAGRTGAFLFPTLNAADSFRNWYESEEGWLVKLADGPNPAAAAEENDPRISYTGTWEVDALPEHSGGTAMRSMEPGAKATITFTGTGLQVIGRRSPSAGTVNVTLPPGLTPFFGLSLPVDTYGSPAEPRALLLSFGNTTGTQPQGTYTVTLEVTGTHGGRSSGNWVWIDGINVLGAPPPAPAP